MLQTIPISEITSDIGLATAPAFLLGAVASMLSLLTNRFNRASDRIHELVRDKEIGGEKALVRARKRLRQMKLAISLCAHSGIITGWMVVLVFIDALLQWQNSRAIAVMFIAAMVLFSAALLLLQLEIRVAIIDLAPQDDDT